MEVVLGALPILLPKLGELLGDEYNLQKEVKGGIRFLQAELETMKAALEDISKTPPDQLPNVDKIWARNVRELSYDIEDNIDTFMVEVKGHHQLAKKHGFKKVIDKVLGSLMQPLIRRKIAIDIRDIKSCVTEVHDRRRRYEVNRSFDKPVKVDPRALAAMVRYKNPTELVGIDESRDEVIKILKEGNEESMEQNKIVSIVGFGGLGKTTLANAVYEELRSTFDCSAFVTVSQTPDMDTLFKNLFYQLNPKKTDGIDISDSIHIIDEIRKFLREKRYLVIIDDIWKISNWEMIRCALPDYSVGYRIITTTRIFTVAEEIGCPYKMKPLSLENSRILMHRRIFGKEDKGKCPDEQLEEVSNRILKKCDGVPLAIITISSLLASKGRNKLEWYDVCKSIGDGLEKNNTIENMRKVLSLSYYDMPSHLRTCLLYLSMFPEDYDIRKDHLIWLWMAEGFIRSTKKDKDLFEQGENYFNELVNRSMIQPIYNEYSCMLESCRVHDMVLDLICSLSNEENFVTILNNMVHSYASKKVRRLSHQNGNASHGKLEATFSKEYHVRSVIIFRSSIDLPIVFENFSILRILDLQGCRLPQGFRINNYICNLLHLRYLGLRDTGIDEIPEDIGNLQFLQVLSVYDQPKWKERRPASLPSTIVRLTQLMCLSLGEWTEVPEGILGNLTALEKLAGLCIRCNGKMLDELASLNELKVLDIYIMIGGNDLDIMLEPHDLERDDGVDKSVVECLNKLRKIQSLEITMLNRECNLDGWVVTAPQNLRKLAYCWFATLPTWLKVNPSVVVSLSYLRIRVNGLQQDDLQTLGRLPALRYLKLRVKHGELGIHGRFIVPACSFPCLVNCWLRGFGGPVVFQHGAMPRLLSLEVDIPVQRTKEDNNGSFDLGLGNLLALQRVQVWFNSVGAGDDEVFRAEQAVMHSIRLVHPNHPIIVWNESWTDYEYERYYNPNKGIDEERVCQLWGFGGPVVFEEGAVPRIV